MDKAILNSLTSGLNDKQLQAVTHTGSPLLILAGPGSGKTKVITHKIAWLIYELQYMPEQILAMTFTNKAAKEMVELVQSLIGLTKRKARICTFHSLGAYLLRLFAEEAGVNRDFQIYDADDQLSLLKETQTNVDKKQLKGILTGISRAKDAGLRCDAPKEKLELFLKDPHVYTNYEKVKKNTGNVDFGDLLLLPYTLLKEHAHVKEKIRNWWKWFLIDEYQDTNKIQFLLLQELCGHTTNVCVVGDDDQSIYGFRGAVVDNILTFKDHVKHTTVIKLEQNYRSSPEILKLANQVIAGNDMRHGKLIFSTLQNGPRPTLVMTQEEDEELDFVVQTARNTLQKKDSCAIFFRTNAQSRSYEMALQMAKIPYVLVGSLSFFQRAEIKDMLALARIYCNTKDVVSFLRIANKPTRGIGKKSLDIVAQYMKEGHTWQDATKLAYGALPALAKKGLFFLQEVFTIVKKQEEEAPQKMQSISSVCEILMRQSNLLEFYQKQDREENTDKIANIKEFLSYTAEFTNDDEGWSGFLERISLAEGNPIGVASDGIIQLMTLHKSKGLEFDTVLLCGAEENNIPMMRFFDNDTVIKEEIEEERRLFYVGITRAKQNLFITCSKTRRKFGKINFYMKSSFLDSVEDTSITLKELGVGKNAFKHVNKFRAQNLYSTDKKPDRSFVDSTVLNDDRVWKEGCKVVHEQYGEGFVRSVSKQGAHTVVQVEFNNETEGVFIPKFAAGLKIVKE